MVDARGDGGGDGVAEPETVPLGTVPNCAGVSHWGQSLKGQSLGQFAHFTPPPGNIQPTDLARS
jgi:hypothetical protein